MSTQKTLFKSSVAITSTMSNRFSLGLRFCVFAATASGIQCYVNLESIPDSLPYSLLAVYICNTSLIEDPTQFLFACDLNS
eukprot:c52702_g1_i1 orf=62-304(+)